MVLLYQLLDILELKYCDILSTDKLTNLGFYKQLSNREETKRYESSFMANLINFAR